MLQLQIRDAISSSFILPFDSGEYSEFSSKHV